MAAGRKQEARGDGTSRGELSLPPRILAFMQDLQAFPMLHAHFSCLFAVLGRERGEVFFLEVDCGGFSWSLFFCWELYESEALHPVAPLAVQLLEVDRTVLDDHHDNRLANNIPRFLLSAVRVAMAAPDQPDSGLINYGIS
ncbi:uncharacterized protein ColSpa_09059 [Colletotrichum spaethianum]|uniref:Uncharacterized protein n=1 Tax=Colletotrichum spaethianum TaxID=700344 RepID=A0AA37PAV6_9PEZI|nr:uncharacterized protein ColSpa_09059 [Colletotrichum spaethianum]GKT48878.1 hypothetical protein ColSpa_09059 [Colletotrichum spaethianum]